MPSSAAHIPGGVSERCNECARASAWLSDARAAACAVSGGGFTGMCVELALLAEDLDRRLVATMMNSSPA